MMMPEFDCPIVRKWLLVLVLAVSGMGARAQQNQDSSAQKTSDISIIDTSINYEELFRDFDAFMDSILAPHSYFMGSVAVSKGYYNFDNKNNSAVQTSKLLTYSPTLGYYHQSGFGITNNGYLVNDKVNLNLYQFSITPSYDYLKNKKLAAGVSFSKFFTKDSLPFYTSPLQNELYGYFTWRKSWVRPSLAISYGWGSRSDAASREELIRSLRLRLRGFTYINTRESISDFSLTTSLRHDFYWLYVFTYRDHIRFTPQLSFTSGTQKFGFNQSSTTYALTVRNSANVLYSSEEIYLDDKINFQPLSLTCYLRGEYSIGKFFVQPEFIMDYYLPSTSKNFNMIFSINAGVVF